MWDMRMMRVSVEQSVKAHGSSGVELEELIAFDGVALAAYMNLRDG